MFEQPTLNSSGTVFPGNGIAEQNLSSMLRSMNAEIQLLALTLLENHRISRNLVTDLVALAKFARDRRLRYSAGELLRKALPLAWQQEIPKELSTANFRPDESTVWFCNLRGRSIIDTHLLARYLYQWDLISLPAYIKIGVYKPRLFFKSFVRQDRLDLSRLQLSEVPSELAQLHELKQVDLSGNHIRQAGRILARIHGLEELVLDDNGLEKLNPTIARLDKLIRLSIARNHLRIVPEGISHLESLRSLDLSDNDLEILPRSIVELKHLCALRLRGNLLTDLPLNFGELNALKILSLARNQLRELPDDFASAHCLRALDISHNQLSKIPDWLQMADHLQHLDLEENPWEVLPEWLADLPALQTVVLGSIPDRTIRPLLDRWKERSASVSIHIASSQSCLADEFPGLDIQFI